MTGMKATEFIRILQEAIAEHGDCDMVKKGNEDITGVEHQTHDPEWPDSFLVW